MPADRLKFPDPILRMPVNADKMRIAVRDYRPREHKAEGMVGSQMTSHHPRAIGVTPAVPLGEEPDHIGQVATRSNYTIYTPNPSRAGCIETEASADHGVESQFIENSPVALAESKRPKIVFNMKGEFIEKFLKTPLVVKSADLSAESQNHRN